MKLTRTQWRSWTILGAVVVIGLGFGIGVLAGAMFGEAFSLVAAGAVCVLVIALATWWKRYRPDATGKGLGL